MKYKEYVLGFAFTVDKSKVVLIEKQKPDWQKGKFNGVGGKIDQWVEETKSTFRHIETSYEAMIREFKEETSVTVTNWQHFATMTFNNDIMGGGAKVHCFRAFTDLVKECITTEEEQIFLLPTINVLNTSEIPIIKNLLILIPMALDKDFRFSELDII